MDDLKFGGLEGKKVLTQNITPLTIDDRIKEHDCTQSKVCYPVHVSKQGLCDWYWCSSIMCNVLNSQIVAVNYVSSRK